MSSVIVGVLAMAALVIEVVIMRVLEKHWIKARAALRCRQLDEGPHSRLGPASS